MPTTLTIILDGRYEITQIQDALDAAVEAVQMSLNNDDAIYDQHFEVKP